MAEITAALVKELREKSGAGMMDCKKALTRTGGDMEAAVDWLRAKGLSKAAKKADRVAAEGLVAVALARGRRGHDRRGHRAQRRDRLRRPQRAFQAAARKVGPGRAGRRRRCRRHRATAKRRRRKIVSDMITGLIATIGENMVLRRAARFEVSPGAVGDLRHNAGSRPTSAASACWSRSKARATRPAEGARPQHRHARGGHRAAVAVDRRSRPGRGRTRTRHLHRTGRRLRQAAAGGREDGRGPHPQVLRGGRAPEAGLCDEPGPDRRAAGGRDRQGRSARRSSWSASPAWPWAKASRRRPTTSPPKSPRSAAR